MSDTAINIRIFFWHWQVNFKGEWSFILNRHRIKKGKRKSILFPVGIYDFKPWKIKGIK